MQVTVKVDSIRYYRGAAHLFKWAAPFYSIPGLQGGSFQSIFMENITVKK